MAVVWTIPSPSQICRAASRVSGPYAPSSSTRLSMSQASNRLVSVRWNCSTSDPSMYGVTKTNVRGELGIVDPRLMVCVIGAAPYARAGLRCVSVLTGPRTRAALGSVLFLVVAPGVAAGLVPWLLTGWDAAG